jgi:superfamily II DNA or RNA helicase
MTALIEKQDALYIFSDSITFNKEIDVLLRAKMPNLEYNTRYQMGKIDGYQRFYDIKKYKNGWLIRCGKGFKKLLQKNLSFDKIDIQDSYFSAKEGVEFLKEVIPTLPFKPYNHQLKSFLGFVSQNEHLAKLSTGAGKSLLLYLTSLFFMKHNKKCLIVVPTIMLVNQLYSDFKDYNASDDFLDSIKLIGGDFKDKTLDKPIVISTWQSLSKTKNYESYDAVIVDEAHTATADILQNILQSNIPMKFGCTGTIPIEMIDYKTLEQIFGEPYSYITARELIDMGLLTDTTIYGLYLKHKKGFKGLSSKLKYNDEIEYLSTNKQRTNFLTKFLKNLNGVSVGLFHRTDYGVSMYKAITGIDLGDGSKIRNDFELQKKLNVFFIDGKTNPKIREKIRKYLETIPDTLLIAQTNVLSTGVNIKRLKNIVMLQSNKSFTTVIQLLGRVMRKHVDKKHVYIFDIVDIFPYKRPSYSEQHHDYRLTFYEYEKHNFDEKFIDLSGY